jgi:hypothetical protein
MRSKFLMHAPKPKEFTMLVSGIDASSGPRRHVPRVIL